MAPHKEHAVAKAVSTHVLGRNGEILVEAGGFTPMRWFLEHGLRPAADDISELSDASEPSRKKRKLERVKSTNSRQRTIQQDEADLIPLFEVSIDFHFPETIHSRGASKDCIAADVNFEDSPALHVVPTRIDKAKDSHGSRMHLTIPGANRPILVLETGDRIAKSPLKLLSKIAFPDHLKDQNLFVRSAERPATTVQFTLSRSRGELYTVVRLEATLKWKADVSAFTAGAPTGTARIYPDYDYLIDAFPDHARDACNHEQPWTPQDFYESVHVPSDKIDTHGQFDDALDVDLYPFQKRAVLWMLAREKPSLKGSARSFYTPVEDADGQICYVNHLQGIISRNVPEGSAHVSGGILAEEMGLGKTVELMALVSLQRRPTILPGKVVDEASGTTVMPSRATLIVTPGSILQQWQSELSRHAPHLSVYHYQGIPGNKKKDVSIETMVDQLATAYDVVLTTYSVLTREVHFATDPPDRNMRHDRRFERKRSPLVQLEWWRICLDEAQMVESGVTGAAKVACRLPRVHSWAVSGTPLRKNVQDLHGLLIFLRYAPLNENGKLWGHLVANHKHLFRTIFGQIALRHTKAQIREELRLPPQKRVVVTVPFSVIEQQNYTELFQQMCDDVGLDATGAPTADDWNPDSEGILSRMRSWLVRLRQTCLHPQVGGRNRRALGKGARPLRTVAEVLEVMIEQNETSLRAEEREVVAAALKHAHILGNNGEDEHRSEKALEIYNAAVNTTAKMVDEARRQLASVHAAKGARNGADSLSGSDDEEPSPELGRHRNTLRDALKLHHVCTFFAATAYYQIKSNEALTIEESEEFKELESKEVELYDIAKAVRREILQDTSRKAEASMRQIKSLQSRHGSTATNMPKTEDLVALGGIESRKIVEKSDELFDVIRNQVEVIKQWREKMAEFLLKPLVDEELEGIETTGDEYEDSTKQQDELYVYFDAFKALHADLNTIITGESAPLIDHEVKMAVKAAKRFLDPDTPEELRQIVHAPELTIELYATRNKFRAEQAKVGSVRGLIQEARSMSGSLELQLTGARAAAEYEIIKQYLSALQKVHLSYSKALAGLEKEVDLFRMTQNQRVDFYRQLQELSDAVQPYKEEHDPHLDTHALESVMNEEEKAKNARDQLRTKHRFLLHLRDESGEDQSAEPKICIICTSTFEVGILTVCGHQFCKECIEHWHSAHRTCPVCKRKITKHDMHPITYKPRELRAQEEVQQSEESSPSQSSVSSSPSAQSSIYTDVDSKLLDEVKSIDLPSSYGTKIDTIARHLHWIREHDPGAKSIVFSQYREFLDVLGTALKEFKIGSVRLGRSSAADRFRHDPSIECLLLDAKTDSSGLTLVNATHVFICEPLIQTAVELQAIARVHRIGQTRPTTVWMYLINDTVEEAIYELSVARRMAHVQARQQISKRQAEKSRSSTPAPLQETAIDAANSEELQAAPLTKLLVAGRSEGELVGNDDLWQCLFGKAQKKNNIVVEREVSRHLRAEAADERRSHGGVGGNDDAQASAGSSAISA